MMYWRQKLLDSKCNNFAWNFDTWTLNADTDVQLGIDTWTKLYFNRPFIKCKFQTIIILLMFFKTKTLDSSKQNLLKNLNLIVH